VEKCELKRSVFIKTLENYPQHTRYYVDECGIDKYVYREYGYSPKGIPIIGNISGKKYKRTNIVAAKCGDTIVAPMVYEGTTDSHLFEQWFDFCLLKAIPKHSVIILDNATFHRKSKLHALAEQHDCYVLFLPPYSPDLNPIEKFWAWLKSRLRNTLHNFNCFDRALVDCFSFI